MRHSASLKFPFFVLCAAAFGLSSARGNSLDPYYDFNYDFGGGSVSGFIAADLGPINNSTDINDWDITVNDGTHSYELTGPLSGNNSTVDVAGADMTANPGELDFNFSAHNDGHVEFMANDFPAQSFFDIFTDISLDSGLSWSARLGDPTLTDAMSGSRAVAETPLPAALPLFASGLGAIGFFGWRRKRKMAATRT